MTKRLRLHGTVEEEIISADRSTVVYDKCRDDLRKVALRPSSKGWERWSESEKGRP